MPRNPADLLGISRDLPVIRLLRACGTDEALLNQGSDYDRFMAFAAAVPLCAGHALAAALVTALQSATGLAVPLCPHTADLYWQAWIQQEWYGREASPVTGPETCPDCDTAVPLTLFSDALVRLPDPLGEGQMGGDLSAWTTCLMETVSSSPKPLLLFLPPDYSFARPDPYHAAVSFAAARRGQADVSARDLLFSQALRVIGEAAKEGGKTLLLVGGDPDALREGIDYLSSCNRLPDMVWFPEDPADAGQLSGLYPQVRTGYTADGADLSAPAAYAAAAPAGRAVVWIKSASWE